MLRLRTKLTIRSRVVAKCERHTRYNPEIDGRAGIKGECARCIFLYTIYNTQQTMLNAARDFSNMTSSYEQIKPRMVDKKKTLITT